jgi:hypothetical protein
MRHTYTDNPKIIHTQLVISKNQLNDLPGGTYYHARLYVQAAGEHFTVSDIVAHINYLLSPYIKGKVHYWRYRPEVMIAEDFESELTDIIGKARVSWKDEIGEEVVTGTQLAHTVNSFYTDAGF